MDPKSCAEFSVGADEESEMSTNETTSVQLHKVKEEDNSTRGEKAPSVSASASASNRHSGSSLIQGEETVSKWEDSVVKLTSKPDKGRKLTAHVKDPSGKRKVKVDWTPELHRKFVEAVEHLGVDKAVPSKILELMGIDCLTRHNVASHLQKYRSHRKHLLAREAEAATWTRRRQVYGSTAGRTGRRDAISCVPPPTAGFPPHFRPLHVWGHPSVDQSLVSTWPSHLGSSPCAWTGDPSFWYCHHQDVPAPGMPCYPPSFLPAGFPSPAVPGVPPASMYRVAPTIGIPVPPAGQTVPKPPFDSHPSKESIDAVIGDVLSKPWLPLPLGLKPPSTDSVVVELQRQGISKIPPSCA